MAIIPFLHRFKVLRQLAKLVGKRVNIKQKFYNGYIFLNAVEHSWAWTGNRNYNNFDAEIQKYIHHTSAPYNQFIDIGCNVGVMTLGTLLNNDTIKCTAIDANINAVRLLNKSLNYNGLANRCRVINAVVGTYNGFINFDSTGSVTGHVSPTGSQVKVIKLADLLNEYSGLKTFVKVDIEGYETEIIDELISINNKEGFRFLMELHPSGFNGVGNPQYVYDVLKALNATVTDIHNNILTAVPPHEISQIAVTFN